MSRYTEVSWLGMVIVVVGILLSCPSNAVPVDPLPVQAVALKQGETVNAYLAVNSDDDNPGAGSTVDLQDPQGDRTTFVDHDLLRVDLGGLRYNNAVDVRVAFTATSVSVWTHATRSSASEVTPKSVLGQEFLPPCVYVEGLRPISSETITFKEGGTVLATLSLRICEARLALPTPGKYAVVPDMGTGDADADGIPDFADGYNAFGPGSGASTHKFLKVTLSLPAPIDVASAQVAFLYDGSAPGETVRQADGTYVPGAGGFRVWRADGNVARSAGDYLIPTPPTPTPADRGKLYLATELGFAATTVGRSRTFYVEAVRASPLPITWERLRVRVLPDKNNRNMICEDSLYFQFSTAPRVLTSVAVVQVPFTPEQVTPGWIPDPNALPGNVGGKMPRMLYAVCRDQYGFAVTPTPPITWESAPAIAGQAATGTVEADGKFTPGSFGGFSVTATAGVVKGTSTITTWGAQTLSYVSEIDHSTQFYSIYIPRSYDFQSAAKVVFLGKMFYRPHGLIVVRPGSIDAKTAERCGYVVFSHQARGGVFHYGIAEDDFRCVRSDIETQGLRVDGKSVYFIGDCMGASGAYRFGVLFPDILAGVGGIDGWADYRIWHGAYYAPLSDPDKIEPYRVPNLEVSSPVDMAVRAEWTRHWIFVNGRDGTVSPEHGRRLALTLYSLAETMGDRYVFDYSSDPKGYHIQHRDEEPYYSNRIDFLLGASLVVSPKHVINKTKRLRYGKLYWTDIERVSQWNSWATVEATVTASAVNTQITVTAPGTQQFRLKLDDALVELDGTPQTGKPLIVTVDGVVCYNAAYAGAIELVFRRKADQTWERAVAPGDTWHKSRGYEGPIGDAFTVPFVVYHGADPADDTRDDPASLAEAKLFCAQWNDWMHGGTHSATDVCACGRAHGAGVTSVRATKGMDLGIAAGHNLILFGTSETNELIRKLEEDPDHPIRVSGSRIQIPGVEPYNQPPVPRYGVRYVFPNPVRPDSLVVVNHNSMMVPGGVTNTKSKDFEALAWYWPDYVVFDYDRADDSDRDGEADHVMEPCYNIKPDDIGDLNYLPREFEAVGYFSESWQWLPPMPR